MELCRLPVATDLNPSPILIGLGDKLSRSPSPNSPIVPSPHAHKLPSALIANASRLDVASVCTAELIGRESGANACMPTLSAGAGLGTGTAAGTVGADDEVVVAAPSDPPPHAASIDASKAPSSRLYCSEAAGCGITRLVFIDFPL